MNNNQAYNENIMPGMTVGQAVYIVNQPLGTFPYDVQFKAQTILVAQQAQQNLNIYEPKI